MTSCGKKIAEKRIMTKSKLIESIADRNKIPKETVETVINNFIDEIKISLIQGDKVQLSGFGTFNLRDRAARNGRHPRTGEEIQVSAYKLPYFTAGKSFKAAVKS